MMLGQRIKEERENQNWTQDDLAEKINVSSQAISKWELATAYPDIDRLIQLSELFNVSLDSLIKGDGDLQKKISIKKETGHMNFWEFITRYYWIVFILVFGIGGWLTWLIPTIINSTKQVDQGSLSEMMVFFQFERLLSAKLSKYFAKS